MSYDKGTPFAALPKLATLVVLLSLMAPLSALGTRYETWHCRAHRDVRKDVLVTLKRHRDEGEVLFRSRRPQRARFEATGADRNWYFPHPSFGHWRYRFTIEPDGMGLYFDFSRSTEEPIKLFRCRMES